MSLDALDSQIEDIRARASEIHAFHSRESSGIDRDPNLTDAGKAEMKKTKTAETRSLLNGLRDQEKTLVASKVSDLQRQLDAKVGSTSTDIIAFRDAQERAERIDAAEDAERVMARALRNDDTTLAHAVFRRGIDHGWRGVVEQFTSAKPDSATAANDLTVLKRFQDDGLNRAMTYGLIS